MSDVRVPDEIFLHRLPKNSGKKTGKISIKYELFVAGSFAERWSTFGQPFYPKPPLRTEDRNEYWKTMYRIRKNGRWVGEKARYHFFTRRDVIEMIVGKLRIV